MTWQSTMMTWQSTVLTWQYMWDDDVAKWAELIILSEFKGRIDCFVDITARRLQQLPPLSKTWLPPLSQPTIPTVLKPGSLPPLPSILNLPTVILSQELVVDGGGKRKGIEGMVVEIVGIKGKLGRVTFGALDKLGMLGSRGSEPGFNIVGIIG
ncbi:hypothetical protein GQ457_13G009940 [Hibiscus cannabinus]